MGSFHQTLSFTSPLQLDTLEDSKGQIGPTMSFVIEDILFNATSSKTMSVGCHGLSAPITELQTANVPGFSVPITEFTTVGSPGFNTPISFEDQRVLVSGTNIISMGTDEIIRIDRLLIEDGTSLVAHSGDSTTLVGSRFNVIETSVDMTLTAPDCSSFIINTNAAAEIIITLPDSPPNGALYHFARVEDQLITVMSNSVNIMLPGQELTANILIGAVGSSFSLVAFQESWLVVNINGQIS